MTYQQPSDAPPAYEAATKPSGAASASSSHAPVPAQAHAQPAGHSGGEEDQSAPRPSDRDIESENRPLPPGWVPQYDTKHSRFFFVDTNPSHPDHPRATWVHPLDDPEWLATVPRGMEPMQWVEELWNREPEPTPEPQRRTLPQKMGAQGGGMGGPGYRQGNTQGMQGNYPGGPAMTQNQGQSRMVSMEDLVQYELSKMGTPEEYERKHPPGKASQLFHKKESASKRQRRHAEHRARDLADQLSYRSPAYSPYSSPYGYPAYGRGYGGMYPGFGMSGALLGLGGGALLGAALF